MTTTVARKASSAAQASAGGDRVGDRGALLHADPDQPRRQLPGWPDVHPVRRRRYLL